MHQLTKLKILRPLGLCVAVAGGTAACGAHGDPTASDNMAMKEAEACPQEAKQQGKLQEKDKLVGEALGNVCLSEEQRAAAEQLGAQVTTKEHEVEAAHNALMAALADQIQAGTIDKAALKAQIEEVVKARHEATLMLGKVFASLHKILTTEQRAGFVDAIHARAKELADESGASKEELDAEHTKAAAGFEAFKKDAYSPAQTAPLTEVGEQAQERTEGMITFAKDLVAKLTPEQRAEIANAIREKLGAPAKESTAEESTAKEKIAAPAPKKVASEEGPGSTSQQAMIVFGGWRTGMLGGWGRGFGVGGFGVRSGFGFGYPYGGFGFAGYPYAGFGFAGYPYAGIPVTTFRGFYPFGGYGFRVGSPFVGGYGRFLW